MRKGWSSSRGSAQSGAATQISIGILGGSGFAQESDGRLRRNSLIVCGIVWDGDPGTVTPPSGWTEAENRNFITGIHHGAIYHYVTGNSEPTNRTYTFSWVTSRTPRILARVFEHIDPTNIYKTGAEPSNTNSFVGGNVTNIGTKTHTYAAGEIGIGLLLVSGAIGNDFITNHSFGGSNRYDTDGDHDLFMFSDEDISSTYSGLTTVGSLIDDSTASIFMRAGQAKIATSLGGLSGTITPARNYMNYHFILNIGAPTVDDASGDDTWTAGDSGIVVNGLDFL